MKITKDNIEYIASLAHVKIKDEEVESYLKDFEDITNFTNTISEIDTIDVEPTFQTFYLENVFREDVISNDYDRQQILQNAPSQYDGCFEVPRVVE